VAANASTPLRGEQSDILMPRALSKKQLSTLKRRVYSANYRAYREYGREEKITLEEVLALLAKDPTCVYCNRRISASTLSLDHLVPLAHDGKNSIDNIVLSCRRDNRFKRAIPATLYKEFLEHLGGFQELFFANYRPQSYRRYRG
jgi:5-methylcytosine-specific restriction endonuclease McrA